MSVMIHIDGSQGEGGGQMLRSALALSMATGRPFAMVNIRAGRAKPGLMRQHLTCVQAAAAICAARVQGAEVGSMAITFEPGPVQAGNYTFQVGTAGSVMLVLQAILPALIGARAPSMVAVEGGTHAKAAPTFEFFERALVPLMNQTGAGVTARLERHGFYPAGGGRVVVEVAPAVSPSPLTLLERGARVGACARVVIARLGRSVADREIDVLRERLGVENMETEVVEVRDSISTGNAAAVVLRYEHITEVVTGLGEVGKSAEAVARDLAQHVHRHHEAGVPVGEFLADQLMVPLATGAGGRFATSALTEHSRTNMAIIAAFGGTVSVDQGGVVEVARL